MRLFAADKPLMADILGTAHPVKLRRNAQAKKMVLRVDALSGEIKLTAPPHVSSHNLQKFLDENNGWLMSERAKVNARPPIEGGSMVPLSGVPHRVHFADKPPRKVSAADGEIYVGGPADQAPARLLRWLKAQAKDQLTEDAHHYADMLQVQFKRVSIGDMKSRWGSCSSSGTLRFNWRLIMAEPRVRQYVAAHEVAHILEMNHSSRFWRHVARCMPSYKAERKWLKTHGQTLMQIRFNPSQTTG